MSLLAAPTTIYDMEPELQKVMSAPTWRRILRQSFGEFRLAARRTDICTHCNTFYTKLVPDFKAFLEKSRRDLVAIIPSYFSGWDETKEQEDSSKGDWAAVASGLLQYIRTHHQQYPLERAELSRADRLTLWTDTEAPIQHEMKGRLSLLRAFQWHIASSRRMNATFESLLDTTASTLPLGDFLLAYDWRQKLKLPMCPEETGQMWHMQQKVSLSCWGGVFVRHAPSSTIECPKIDFTFLLFLTDVIEQTAEASNLMLQAALNACSVPTTGSLQLWSDTGPHFRSAENLFFYARVLPATRKQKVLIRFLGEQHGKSILDKMFGWTGTHSSGWLGKYARKQPILDLNGMVRALQAGAQEQKRKDPLGPNWIVKKMLYPETKTAERNFLYGGSLKITRTYALDAEPYTGSLPNASPILFNRVFADSADRVRVSDWSVETVRDDDPQPWRKAFFEGAKDWEQGPPDWQNEHHLKRVYEAQKNKLPPRQILPVKTFQEKVASKEKSRARANSRFQRRLERVRQIRNGYDIAENSSVDATSSSSDSSESSAET